MGGVYSANWAGWVWAALPSSAALRKGKVEVRQPAGVMDLRSCCFVGIGIQELQIQTTVDFYGLPGVALNPKFARCCSRLMRISDQPRKAALERQQ
jgi:hypothetical protein